MADPEHLRIARAGKSAWDSWRRAHPSESTDFSGTDFTVRENRDIVFSGFEFEGDADFRNTIFGDTPGPYRKGCPYPSGSPGGAALFDALYFAKTRISGVHNSGTTHGLTKPSLNQVLTLLTHSS
ncbi:MAG: hypothetical protein R3B11_03015 [Nitrospira sp.]|nr:hypothetical protein [Nitrospira sp.]